MKLTLDEAMTDLSIQREAKRRLGKDREAHAIGVGIEAIKRIKVIRGSWPIYTSEPLPGETE